jgi:16S rRNA (uracil1498-N3)-methyltransferase
VRRFQVTSLGAVGDALTLDEEARRHLVTVLRARAGEAVELFDGKGHAAIAEVVTADKRAAVVRQTTPPSRQCPDIEVHLGIATLKGPAMDLAVRMATEAGVTHLHPMRTARSVATGDRAERWLRIAASAAAQCGRADIPEVEEVAAFHEVVSRLSALPRRFVAHVASAGAAPGAPNTTAAALLVGPEGGFEEEEVRRAVEAGYAPLSLGRWVLRAPTAAAVAVALVAG